MGPLPGIVSGLVLLVASTVWTVPAAATSTPTISLSVSDERVVHGSTVTMTGTIPGRWAPGTRVEVQRQPDAGTRWVSFARSRVRDDHTWRLRTEPARGSQAYRARVVAPDGSARFSTAVTVVAVWRPAVAVSVTRELVANQWRFTATGEVPHAGGAHAGLWGNWSGEWKPLYAGDVVAPGGRFAIRFTHGGGSQVRVCISKDPDEGRREGCSAPVTPDASHVSATLTVIEATSGVRALGDDPDSGIDRYEQYTEMQLETDAPASSVVVFSSRPPGGGEWVERGGILTGEPGLFRYRLLPVPDGHEVRAMFMDGVIDAPATTPFVTHIPAIDAALDRIVYVDGIGPDDGTRLRFDVAAGQVFHPLVQAGYPGMAVRVEAPDGTALSQRTIDVGVGGPVVFYQALTTGTHTAFITPLDTNDKNSKDAFVHLRTPAVLSGPSATDQVLTAPEDTTTEYRFQADAGDMVTRAPDVTNYDGCGRLDLFEAGDYEHPIPEVVRPHLPWEHTLLYEIPRSGEYVWRMTPQPFCDRGRRLWVVDPTRVSATPSRQSFPVTLPPGGWLGVTFDATQGDDIWVQAHSDPDHDFLHDDDFPPDPMEVAFVTTPSGDVVRPDFVAGTTGTYTYWARPYGTASMPEGGADFGVIVELRRR